ncbi:hypothetical protein PybrP1_000908 [[Pythium] brassicae (nom. inval.)]|nr:hypothetical protein PybrP1_000908 [[Pythium] brassicae (nom. inval.)]
MTQYAEEQTTRSSDPNAPTFPTAYDDKDDFSAMKEKLAARKKPIYAGLAFLCVVVVGVSIGVSTSGGTTANTQSGVSDLVSSATNAPAGDSVASDADSIGDAGAAGMAGKVSAGSVWTEAPVKKKGSSSSSSSRSGSGSGSHAGVAKNTTQPTPAPSPTPGSTTVAPTPEPTEGPLLPFSAVDFDWTSAESWEYSGGGNPAGGMVSKDGIKLTPANSAQPIRSKQGWGGEKIVLIEWENSATSDTNIWMLNTKIQSQFGVGNGWPYWGELDIFEMFNQDALDKKLYDFSGNAGGDAASYGQLTLHNGPRKENGDPCFCPASPTKKAWFQNTAPMTSGCTAQFANTRKNSIATVWGRDGSGQYLQLIQNPTVTKGGKKNKVDTYDITTGGGAVTSKIYNNAQYFWGTPASAPCAAGGGHNPATGFPFFEDFRIILEEQKKGDSSAWFKVTNIQIFKKN